jgi:hypothetical protein
VVKESLLKEVAAAATLASTLPSRLGLCYESTQMRFQIIFPRIHGCCLISALAILAMMPESAFAGAPFQTDDPVVIDVAHTDIVVFNQQTLAASGRSGTLAGVEIHYGPIPNLEVDLGMPYNFDFPTDGSAQRGYGDTTLALKYRLIQESDTKPQVSFLPKLNLSTGNADRGLGNGGDQLFLALALQKNSGKLQMNVHGGYWINNGAENRNYWFLGWQAQYAFTSHWRLGIEVFHTSPQVVGQGRETGFNVGGYYLFDSKNQVLFSAGKGLQNAAETNRVSTYLGYQRSL